MRGMRRGFWPGCGRGLDRKRVREFGRPLPGQSFWIFLPSMNFASNLRSEAARLFLDPRLAVPTKRFRSNYRLPRTLCGRFDGRFRLDSLVMFLVIAVLLTMSYVAGEGYRNLRGKNNKAQRKADWEAFWWAFSRFPFSLSNKRATEFAKRNWAKYGKLIIEEEGSEPIRQTRH